METPIKNPNHFDYIIIGGGVAGLHIAMQMNNDSFFSNKSIAIFDKAIKNTNDKTFCFWEKGIGKWESCVTNSWKKTFFKDTEHNLEINLNPYTYKQIKSIDFYNYCKKNLKDNSSFSFFTDEIATIEELNTSVTIYTSSNKKYSCEYAFDSRLGVSTETIKKKATYISQSFKGWVIKTTTPIFDSNILSLIHI